ncbi:gliding motility protein SprC [Flavobacterium ginsenosidimutans]|uniref:Gliding motility protein SprC n=1 Tax=Flavobacterium ginsenosidimutans TaxID=687844 RepID=A0ABZ2QCX1_9FLAO|nr:gliding motility protein SprC [Flavobacterium ginsenosidimutans]KAF2335867.1 gliding motility protein SprC [Flavobacterium ginsenosidimutans]
MIQKITLSFTKLLLLFSILFFAKSSTYAQTIVPQTFDGLEKLCAGNSFNEFYATFSYIDFPAGTTFVVELSDAAGNFTSPVSTTLLQTIDVSATQQTIKYAVPTDLVGSDIYSLRVKSSTGVTSTRFKNSLGNTSFPAYFKQFEGSFFINNKSDVAMLCSGGSLTLSISTEDPSPASIANIKYKWYKDDVLIAGQSSKELVVNSTGKYYAEIDYGQCSDVNFSSNRVNVTSSSSGSAVTIDSSLGNPFCASGTGTVLTATSGNSYVWKKDGVIITGATTRTYSTNESGVYSVEVDFGGCKAIGSIDLQSNSFEATIDAQDGYKLNEGETITVTVTTDATGATYEWYLNNNLISGQTANSYVISVKGNYKVIISQVSGCIASKEFSFRINGDSTPSGVIPNIIKLSGMNPYWNIPDEYKNATTKVIIISSNGDKVLDVVNYQGDWPQNNIDFKNVNPVYYYVIQSDTGEKKGSITVIK